MNDRNPGSIARPWVFNLLRRLGFEVVSHGTVMRRWGKHYEFVIDSDGALAEIMFGRVRAVVQSMRYQSGRREWEAKVSLEEPDEGGGACPAVEIERVR